MRWIQTAFEDQKTPGHASIKRIIFACAGISLSICTIILSVAACFGQQVDIALATVTAPLAGLAGYGYVNGKRVERQNADNKD